jgi:hypothetical protein
MTIPWDLRDDEANTVDLEEREHFYQHFLLWVWVFAAHVAVILVLLAWIFV